MRRGNRRHSIEEKRSALAEYYSGISVGEICRKYEISSGLFWYWKRMDGSGRLNGNQAAVKALQKRVDELERMVGKLTMENELLKKAKEFFQERARKRESLYQGVERMDGQCGKDVR